MLKKTILTGVVLLGMSLVGCQSTYSNVKADGPDVKKVSINSKGRKVVYEDFKINIPKTWEQSNIDNMDIYKIEERNSNLSISVVNGENLEKYIESIKDYSKAVMGVEKIEECSIKTSKGDMISIAYCYNIGEKETVYINQSYMKFDDRIYVFTLMSDEDDYEFDINELKKVIGTIK